MKESLEEVVVLKLKFACVRAKALLVVFVEELDDEVLQVWRDFAVFGEHNWVAQDENNLDGSFQVRLERTVAVDALVKEAAEDPERRCQLSSFA